jgi:hypothetical protein
MNRNGTVLASTDNLPDHLAVHIRQPEVAPAIAIGQLRVIEAEQVQYGRMQIVHVRLVFDRLKAEIVRGAVGYPAFNAPAGQPDRKTVGIVIAAVLHIHTRAGLHRGSAPEFAAEYYLRILKRPRAFKSSSRAATGASTCRASKSSMARLRLSRALSDGHKAST